MEFAGCRLTKRVREQEAEAKRSQRWRELQLLLANVPTLNLLCDDEGSVLARLLNALRTMYPRGEVCAEEDISRAGRIYDSPSLRGAVSHDLTGRQYDPPTLTSGGDHDFIEPVRADEFLECDLTPIENCLELSAVTLDH